MNIVSLLKEKGFRVTKPRLEIIKVLSNYPLSAEEIHDALDKKNIRVDLASVYRSLELFVKMSVVYSIELGEGKKRYELVNKNYHHHHLICNKCGTIENVEMNEINFDKKINEKSKFLIDHHHLEFFGLCQDCQ